MVQPFARSTTGLVAAQSYIDRNGMPQTEADLAQHHFVGLESSTAPFNDWLAEVAPLNRITFRVDDTAAMRDAIVAGAGIGFMPSYHIGQYPNLVKILTPRQTWGTDFLLITHVDLHRTAKVQALLTFLKAKAKTWDMS